MSKRSLGSMSSKLFAGGGKGIATSKILSIWSRTPTARWRFRPSGDSRCPVPFSRIARLVQPGDWVVKIDDGIFLVCEPEVFDRLFEVQ